MKCPKVNEKFNNISININRQFIIKQTTYMNPVAGISTDDAIKLAG